MKKMLYGIIAAAMIPTFTSCGDPVEVPTEGVMTISVDKTQMTVISPPFILISLLQETAS